MIWTPFTNLILASSNIIYLNLAAKLAHLTGEQSYADAAASTYDILTRIGFITKNFNVYDGAHVDDCKDINKLQFSLNAAYLLEGSAFMYNLVSTLPYLPNSFILFPGICYP